MHCFSCCFRIRDDPRPQVKRVSQPITAIAKEPVDPLASSSVWSVLASEEEGRDLAQREDERYGVGGSPVLEEALRAEAKFLNARGTLHQTPGEIRKIEKSKDSQTYYKDPEPTSHSWVGTTSIEKEVEKQSPIIVEKWDNVSDSSTQSLTSLKNTGGISSNSSEACGIEPAAITQCLNKSVRFESQHDPCSFSSKSSSPKITKVPLKSPEPSFDHITSKPSPNPRIRFQHVYSEMNTKDFSQLDAPIEEEYIEQAEKESTQSQVKLQASTTEKGSNVGPTLSPWLAPKSNSCIDQSLVPTSHGQTPGDRPILGVVTAYWNVDEAPFTPKWGDGNGIPNTTHKYREDQKVSWHATPFEERLEKAIMEDKFIPKRKQHGKTPGIEF